MSLRQRSVIMFGMNTLLLRAFLGVAKYDIFSRRVYMQVRMMQLGRTRSRYCASISLAATRLRAPFRTRRKDTMLF